MLFGRNGKKFLENIYLSLPKNLSSLFAQWKISQAQYRTFNLKHTLVTLQFLARNSRDSKLAYFIFLYK